MLIHYFSIKKVIVYSTYFDEQMTIFLSLRLVKKRMSNTQNYYKTDSIFEFDFDSFESELFLSRLMRSVAGSKTFTVAVLTLTLV